MFFEHLEMYLVSVLEAPGMESKGLLPLLLPMDTALRIAVDRTLCVQWEKLFYQYRSRIGRT